MEALNRVIGNPLTGSPRINKTGGSNRKLPELVPADSVTIGKSSSIFSLKPHGSIPADSILTPKSVDNADKTDNSSSIPPLENKASQNLSPVPDFSSPILMKEEEKLSSVPRGIESQYEFKASFSDMIHHKRGDVNFFKGNQFVKALSSSLRTYREFDTFVSDKMKSFSQKYNVKEEDILLGIKRGLYYAAGDSPSLSRKAHEYIDRMTGKAAGDFGKKAADFLKEAYTVNDLVWVSMEAKPFSTSGGMGTVMGELPRSIAKKGYSVKVVTPKYQKFRTEKDRARMDKALEKYGAKWSGKNAEFFVNGHNKFTEGIYKANVNGVEYILLDNPQLFDGMYYGNSSSEKMDRSVGFARGAFEAMKALDVKPSIVYANDASAAPLPVIAAHDEYIKNDPHFQGICDKTCLILHNPGWKYQNRYPIEENGKKTILSMNIPEPPDQSLTEDLKADNNPSLINLMEAGIKTSGLSIAVSSTTADDVKKGKDGMETGGREVEGILNGIPGDYYKTSWNYVKNEAGNGLLKRKHDELKSFIKKDPALLKKVSKRFPKLLGKTDELMKLEDTPKNRYLLHKWLKMSVQLEQGMKVDPDIPMISMIHRVTDQKGYDLVIEGQKAFLDRPDASVQFIVGGATDKSDPDNVRLYNGLKGMAENHRENVRFIDGFADMRLFASATDLFLMPSKDEPGGISNQEAAALGNVVVVHATGGLKDAVKPIQQNKDGNWNRKGNGFMFNEFNSGAFSDAVNKAIDFVKVSSDEEKIESREWAINNIRSWDDVAEQYISVLHKQLEILPQ